MDIKNKIKILLALSVIAILAGGLGGFLTYQYLHKEQSKPQSFSEDLSSPSDDELEGILDLIKETSGERFIKKYGYDWMKKDSFINVVHIINEDSEYRFSCWDGPSYNKIDWNKFFPGELVAMGQINECNNETILAIDEAVRNPELDCKVYLRSSNIHKASPPVNDYYLASLIIKEDMVITEELFEMDSYGDQCTELFKDFMGEKKPSILTVLVDLITGRIFY